MPHAYQIHKQNAAYFLTPTIVEWVDILRSDKNKQMICDSLNYCIDKKGLEVFSYVIMSTHMHLIASAKNLDLSDVIRDFKKFTSGNLLRKIKDDSSGNSQWMLDIFSKGGTHQSIKSKHQVWQYNNHAVEVYSPKFTLSKIKYIHNNPVEAGLVNFPHEYYFSSARDYAGLKGPVNVSLLSLHNLFY